MLPRDRPTKKFHGKIPKKQYISTQVLSQNCELKSELVILQIQIVPKNYYGQMGNIGHETKMRAGILLDYFQPKIINIT